MTGPIVALLLLVLLVVPCIITARLHPKPPARPIRYPRAKGRPRVRDYVGIFLYEEAKRNGRR
jgi:hypothetical protein